MHTFSTTEGPIADLISEGREYRKGKIEGARRRAIREAKELGVEPKFVEAVTPWAMGLLNECPFLYRILRDFNIAPTAVDPNRGYGDAVHVGAEVLARGGSHADAVKAFGKRWDEIARRANFDGKKYTADELKAMGPKALEGVKREFDSSFILPESVEHWFDWLPIVDPLTGEEIAGFAFSGRCDLIRSRDEDDGFVVTDLKNLAAIPGEPIRKLTSASNYQLTMYVEMAQADSLFAEYDVTGATQIIANKAKREIKVITLPVHYSTPEDARALFYSARDAIMRILTYRAQEDDGVPLEHAWPRNFNACIGKFGPCDLVKLCHPHLFEEFDLFEEFGQKAWK